MIVANKLLGDSSDSLLFQNVREKLSLCYSIGLLSLKSEGLIMIITEINKSNFDKTIEEIDKQIINAKNGEFDDELFASTKLQFANAIHSLGDDIDGFVAFDMMLKLNNIDISVDEHLRRIMAVKKEDVVRALNTYKKSITYFLKGDLDE